MQKHDFSESSEYFVPVFAPLCNSWHTGL